MDASTKDRALRLLAAASANCRQVAVFGERSVKPILDRELNVLPYRRICHTLFMRVQAWLTSVVKLNAPADFQGTSAAARALYEAAIDMVLVQYEEGQSVTKLMAWEQSCKLKFAEKRLRLISADQPARDFIAKNKTKILAEREVTWGVDKKGKPRAPDRWTGRNLEEDSRIAEGYVAGGFVTFYGKSYSQTCWYVHGSGAVGILEIPYEFFPTLSGLALTSVAEFGLICAEHALRLFNVFDEISAARLDRLRGELRATSDQIWMGAPSTV